MAQSHDSLLLHAKTKVLIDTTKIIINPKQKKALEPEIKAMKLSNEPVINSNAKVYGPDNNRRNFHQHSSAVFRRKNSNL